MCPTDTNKRHHIEGVILSASTFSFQSPMQRRCASLKLGESALTPLHRNGFFFYVEKSFFLSYSRFASLPSWLLKVVRKDQVDYQINFLVSDPPTHDGGRSAVRLSDVVSSWRWVELIVIRENEDMAFSDYHSKFLHWIVERCSRYNILLSH